VLGKIKKIDSNFRHFCDLHINDQNKAIWIEQSWISILVGLIGNLIHFDIDLYIYIFKCIIWYNNDKHRIRSNATKHIKLDPHKRKENLVYYWCVSPSSRLIGRPSSAQIMTSSVRIQPMIRVASWTSLSRAEEGEKGRPNRQSILSLLLPLRRS
jgi:hypothetical protein